MILNIRLISNLPGNSKLRPPNTASHKDCTFLPEFQPLSHMHWECPRGTQYPGVGVHAFSTWSSSMHVPSPKKRGPVISACFRLLFSALKCTSVSASVRFIGLIITYDDHITETQPNLFKRFHFLMLFSPTPTYFLKALESQTKYPCLCTHTHNPHKTYRYLQMHCRVM